MGEPSIAFKEWAAVVLALERGLQTVIFRRGGLTEERDAFEASHDSFWLLPTYYHQQRTALRSEFASLVDEALTNEPAAGRFRITSWAEVLDVNLVARREELAAYDGAHVYEPQTLFDRLARRDNRALHVLRVRVHLLDEPVTHPLEAEHQGCRSWVPLAPRSRP